MDCKQCGGSFTPRREGHVFCAEKCRVKYRYDANPRYYKDSAAKWKREQTPEKLRAIKFLYKHGCA